MLRLARSLRNQHGSQHFVNRQANDLYVAEARRLGYVCRSAFKLTHIDDKVKLFDKKTTTAVVDLGASPGGWCQVIRQRTGADCNIVGIDILPVRVNLPGALFLQGDVSDPKTQQRLAETLGARQMDRCVDVVTSDMCPNRTGGHDDRQRSAALNEIALSFALSQLRIGGHFICKVLGTRAGSFEGLFTAAARRFNEVQIIKPPACRRESDESFMVCLGLLAEPKTSVGRRSVSDVVDAARTGRRLGVSGRRIDYGLDDWPGARRR